MPAPTDIGFESIKRLGRYLLGTPRLIQQFEFQDAKSVAMPGIKREFEEDSTLMHNPTEYRALAARANYLAQDRVDIQYAAKEISRNMSSPENADWCKSKRLGRYLKGEPRLIQMLCFQASQSKIIGWSDTDHAGCTETRKSTSGGIIQIGGHCIKTWSTTQSVIALSLGEAEYYGLVKRLVRVSVSEA